MPDLKVIFISDDNEIFAAFERAFNYLKEVRLLKYEGKFYSKSNPVLCMFDERGFDTWFWGKFRGSKRALNPLVIIGTEDAEDFVKNWPVFDIYSTEHAYFSVPFDIEKFMRKVLSMRSFHDQTTRNLMIAHCAKEYEWRLIDHDFKIIKGDKGASIWNLLSVLEYYKSKGDIKTTNFIEQHLQGVDGPTAWEEVLLEIKKGLIERYREG